mmetsp:Transcript_14847/g.25267  ORF Transcript_14847/g.25267 Transcript_14847/m.25267 type:complete len:150 (+) Transcript_14847:1514-1963(+)
MTAAQANGSVRKVFKSESNFNFVLNSNPDAITGINEEDRQTTSELEDCSKWFKLINRDLYLENKQKEILAGTQPNEIEELFELMGIKAQQAADPAQQREQSEAAGDPDHDEGSEETSIIQELIMFLSKNQQYDQMQDLYNLQMLIYGGR